MIATSIGASIIAILAVLIGSGAGADFSRGVWPTVGVLPLVGLPIGFVLIVALLVITGIRKSRAARDDRN